MKPFRVNYLCIYGYLCLLKICFFNNRNLLTSFQNVNIGHVHSISFKSVCRKYSSNPRFKIYIIYNIDDVVFLSSLFLLLEHKKH